jgi:N-methylhydantoinase A
MSRSEGDSLTGSWVVAVDVGGTFTDAVAVGDDGETFVSKVPSTPEDPSIGLAEAVRDLEQRGVPLGRLRSVFHGTTVATNAVITGGLARVALACTDGFRDLLTYRTGTRPKLYDLEQPRPNELVRRSDRIGTRERLSSRGDVVVALGDDEIERVVDEIERLRPEAVAVALLFSYLDGRHERALGDALARRLPDLPVTLSSEVAPEFREYPRTATAVVNAGLRPLVGGYVLRARSALEESGARAPFLIMQSNGGSVPAERADREAHRLLLSGPTAGVTGAISLGRLLDVDRLISLDMGGTSLDVCLVNDGVPPITPVQIVDTHPIVAPSVDVVTVGAGGGSIASVDAASRLRVGPESAGADPGPAAYGMGGKEPTLTDAHVVVGSLGAETPLAGRLALDVDAAHEAVAGVAEPLGLGVEEAAEGIIAVGMAHVVKALRRVSVERGVDPREYTLVAFGGAGPLHAGRLLRELGLASVIVPPYPGLFSASGLLAADLRIDDSQTILRTFDAGVQRDVARWYRGSAARLVRQLKDDGIPKKDVRLVGAADLRYVGQGFELTVPLRGIDARSLSHLGSDFHDVHTRTYGHANREEDVEVVTLRLSAFGAVEGTSHQKIGSGRRDPPASARVGERHVLLPGTSRKRSVPVYRREELRARNRIDGPAVVEQMDSTTLLLPNQQARVDAFGNLQIREGVG